MGKWQPRKVESQNLLAHVALGGLNPQLLPTICHFASHCDHRDGKIKDTKLHVSPHPLSQGKMSVMHRKKTRKENICNGGSL